MASDKLLAEWFWVDRWMGSRAYGLPIGARGLYREMLSQAWLRGARLPNDHEQIRRFTAVTSEEWSEAWPLIQHFWRIDGPYLVNDTQIQVYTEAKARQDKAQARAQAGAQARWQADAQASPTQCPPSPSPSLSPDPEPSPNLRSSNELVKGDSPHTTSDPKLLAAPLKPPNGNGNGGNGDGHHPTTTARSKRPIFTGQRLTVFEWMLDECTRTLGPLTDAFDLHNWFFALDTELVKAAIVIQKRDGGVWLQSQLVAEAQRRGLPIAVATPPPSKQSAQLAHTLATIRREEAEKRAARK